MTWVFLFACVAFTCHHGPALPGDGAYYATKAECHAAARTFARQHRISTGRYETVCVERDK